MDPCCAQDDDLATELEDMANDPALQDCCRRDLKEQAYVARVKKALLAQDRTDMRTLVADQAVRHDFEARCAGDADSLASGSDEETPGVLLPHFSLLCPVSAGAQGLDLLFQPALFSAALPSDNGYIQTSVSCRACSLA